MRSHLYQLTHIIECRHVYADWKEKGKRNNKEKKPRTQDFTGRVQWCFEVQRKTMNR